MTKDERDALIARHEQLRVEYVAAHERNDRAESQRLADAADQAITTYFRQLPRIDMSRCPFCQRAFTHSFDPWGPDGFWWQEASAIEEMEPEPEPCPHFGVLQGALNLNGLPPHGLERVEAYVGPDAPFVIPRMLDQEPVVAVISHIAMANGYIAYPIVYFSSRALPPGSFTQRWTRKSYEWDEANGKYGWRVDTDPWDFELAPWVQRFKVLWIEPDDAELRLRSAADGGSPYVGLPGVRQRQFIKGDLLWTTPPPAGEVIDPFAG